MTYSEHAKNLWGTLASMGITPNADNSSDGAESCTTDMGYIVIIISGMDRNHLSVLRSVAGLLRLHQSQEEEALEAQLEAAERVSQSKRRGKRLPKRPIC